MEIQKNKKIKILSIDGGGIISLFQIKNVKIRKGFNTI